MALNLRERFGPKEPGPRRLLGEPFEFSPSRYPSLRDFVVERDEVDLLEQPLALTRDYVLAQGMEGVQLELALCLGGPDSAIDLLFQRASSFQRELSQERIIDVARALQVGDVGIAWQWNDHEPEGVLGFVRFNVLMFARGRLERLKNLARELDSDLARRKTQPEYADGPASFESAARQGALSAAAGARVDLGMPDQKDARYFFVATGGSVNRDVVNPANFYFRAGLAKGDHRIVVYRVGKGLLPDRQTLPVRIS